ncbi:MAG: isoprenylcysteine carboxylmethyltransferase family protein [Cryomorphaceae bacterium]|nr:isoprenylcysteine carboxylmethyltransferase family protein [Flavobacteriales bacterium]
MYLGILWTVYYALHSYFASERVKEFIRHKLRTIYGYYRLLYSLFAAINFFLLAWLHLLVQTPELFSPSIAISIVGVGLIAAGALATVVALKSYKTRFWYRNQDSQSEEKLIRTGLNAYVRHPLYFGALLIVLGVFLVSPQLKNIVLALITFAYIYIGASLEERKLIGRFGDAYSQYRREVKMLIPFVF